MTSKEKESSGDKASLIAASAWMALVDKEQYDRSWETGAQYLKRAITRTEGSRDFGNHSAK